MFNLFLEKMTLPYVLFTNHKNRAIFGLTCKDKRSRDLVTVGRIFNFFFLKMRKTRKKKVSEQRGAIHMRSRAIGKIVEGGGGHNGPPPPPPALLGLKVKTSIGNAPISKNEMEALITNHVKEYVLTNTWW